jgi:CheY-like chemotaxis protein/HPt (histidine-containing phosphotransfer) domain-containing protein
LVVDDSATNRALVHKLLVSYGCHPAEAVDAESALTVLAEAALTDHPFQIALLDVNLSGMSGEDLRRRIASDPKLKRTALVLMTDFGQLLDSIRLEELGFSSQVSKPIWEHSLREALLAAGVKGSPVEAVAESVTSPIRDHEANSQKRILLAEDNRTNQIVAAAMLKKLGYSAHLVNNGVEAIQALREADYDLVLMDCEMPEMDGYQATRRIRDGRAAARNPGIIIIAVTADAMSGDREKCIAAGMSDYLPKPIDPSSLDEILNKWLHAPSAGVKLDLGDSAAAIEIIFNQEEFLARLMGDRDLAAEVIRGFLEDAPRQFLNLKKKLEEADAIGARLYAHSLKGAAVTMSADALLALCRDAQEAVVAGELSRALTLLPKMQEQYELLRSALLKAGWKGTELQEKSHHANTNS